MSFASRILLFCLLFAAPASAQTLKTRWAKDVNADNVHREYPRPQMVRKDWQSLNGVWQLAFANTKYRACRRATV